MTYDELALESRIKEPVSLDNLRDVIKEAIEAGGYLTKEKLEEDTERAYNYHYSNNAIMIAFANLLGLEGRLYALRNGMLELPNIKREDCEIVSDSSGKIWEILLHQLDNGLWIAHTDTYSVVGYWEVFLKPYACKIYPSREAALRYEAQYFLNCYNTIETKNPKWAPYLEQAIKEAKRLGGVR